MGCGCKKKREVVQAPAPPPARIVLTEVSKPQPAQPVPQPSVEQLMEKLDKISK